MVSGTWWERPRLVCKCERVVERDGPLLPCHISLIRIVWLHCESPRKHFFPPQKKVIQKRKPQTLKDEEGNKNRQILAKRVFQTKRAKSRPCFQLLATRWDERVCFYTCKSCVAFNQKALFLSLFDMIQFDTGTAILVEIYTLQSCDLRLGKKGYLILISSFEKGEMLEITKWLA